MRKGSSQININSFNANLMESIAEVEICLDDLLEITVLVFEAINSGKTGVVSPQLVTSKNYIKILETIQKKLYFTELPFPLELKYYILYAKISAINIFLSGERLVYVIHTPIQTGPVYDVLKITPKSIKGRNIIFMTIFPQNHLSTFYLID